ncbi:uncharacterized protein I206_105793 [Kwoniella pini CBS 10737]|uniref:Uncharacterized protein n=1 Tax=Kwoniella pini CBS 10737 TaxID=1296096 RepID=A0A1B9I061_9TREE|nr:uncharacterized protein I206_04613 [Kwoniella pini CBS 10737]OCF48926.1 hypothetical protein I206_04613 [Kwoniella pini CBS 10737]
MAKSSKDKSITDQALYRRRSTRNIIEDPDAGPSPPNSNTHPKEVKEKWRKSKIKGYLVSVSSSEADDDDDQTITRAIGTESRTKRPDNSEIDMTSNDPKSIPDECTSLNNLSEDQRKRIDKFVIGRKAWDEKLSEYINWNYPNLDLTSFRDFLPRCRLERCKNHEFSIEHSNLEGLLKYSESEICNTIIKNWASTGIPICLSHREDEIEDQPETRLLKFEDCVHKINEDVWEIDLEQKQQFMTRPTECDDFICNISVPIWQEKDKYSGEWRDIVMLKNNSTKRFYCSMASYIENNVIITDPINSQQ